MKWVPGRMAIVGTEFTDHLKRTGSERPLAEPEPSGGSLKELVNGLSGT